MKISEIKQGKFYETKVGNGEALKVGGTFPPSVKMNITHPFPRGTIYVSPKDVLAEIPSPKSE